MNRHEKERVFQEHICNHLEQNHAYNPLNQKEVLHDGDYIATDLLLAFILRTQAETFALLQKDYGDDSADEIVRALKEELRTKPLWLIVRLGLSVRKHTFKLYYPKPRSNLSRDAQKLYESNQIHYQKEFMIEGNKRIDIVLYLNGLPIVTLELKHEDAKQNVYDAVEQYTKRKKSDAIFSLAFLHIAMDTSEVQVATNPFKTENFRWFNRGLVNEPLTKDGYPTEYLYAEMLSQEMLLSYLSFFLVYVPKDEKKNREAFSLFPRYHQLRSVNRLATDIGDNLEEYGKVGKNYLINHSAGSGKTLTMCWTADKIHSIYKENSDQKAIDIIFILTDRTTLDKNISDEMENFSYLKSVVKYAKKSSDIKEFVKEKESIVVSTIQKLSYIIDELNEPSLKHLNIAFIVDEAHRSQDHKMGTSVREEFGNKEQKSDDEEGEDEVMQTIIETTNTNMVFVAFTATPSQNTVSLFGETFDLYSEAEAIQEGYILDVAQNIIAYETLYNMEAKVTLTDEHEYPAGVVAQALKNIAFEDEGLIHYKAEIMLRIFEEQVAALINNRAKVMIVTNSRKAGLSYFNILQEKLDKRKCGFPCKVLYAFSDFTHPQSGETINEHTLNGLSEKEKIEERFNQDDYRILVVANKFQTGFNQPLLAGMFLDKTVNDRNAVQTLSRLNRCADGKDATVVVDFSNNVENIFKAFKKYRAGTPYEPTEPNHENLSKLLEEIEDYRLFSVEDREKLVALEDEDAQKMNFINSELRKKFLEMFSTKAEQRSYVTMLFNLLKQYYFLSGFFEFDKELLLWVKFSEMVTSQLIKEGGESELMKALKEIGLTKANVEYKGIKSLEKGESKKPRKGGGGSSTPPPKVALSEMLEKLKEKFDISDEEAIVIREICEEKLEEPSLKDTIVRHKDDVDYLYTHYSEALRSSIVEAYVNRDLEERIMEKIYDEQGAILDTMTGSVIRQGLFDIGLVA